MNRPDRKQFPASAAALLAGLALAACTDGGDQATPVTSTGGGPGTAPVSRTAQQGSQAQNALSLFEQGQMKGAQGDPAGAAENYRRAIGLDPNLAEAHFELGKILVQRSYVIATSSRDQGILGEGIAELKQAAVLRPDDAEFAYWTGRAMTLGSSQEQSGENVEARAWLEKALALDPEHGLAQKRLAMLHAEEQRPEEARAAFLAAQEHLPEDGGVWFQYGNLLESEEDFEGARDAYRRAIEIDATLPGPYAKLAPVLSRLGDDEGAAQAQEDSERWGNYDAQLKQRLTRANRNPKDVEALLRVGEMYFAVEKWEDAESWFSRALNIDQANAQGHLYRGIVMRHLEEYELAMNHLLEASFLAPDSFLPHLELLRVYAAMEDEAKLSEKLTELDAELAADHVDERTQVADVLLEVGHADAARARYEAILAVAPDHEAAKAGLARAGDE